MATTLEIVAMEQIFENDLNSSRSMDKEEIANLADSIAEAGLLHPLTVYKREEGHYVLISGHKRFRALKMLGRMGKSTVQCTVIEKPKTMTEEMEIMARANVFRNDPEEIKNEVKIVNAIWNTMENSRRAKLREKFRVAFESASMGLAEYQSDPKKFMDNRFRPRIEYIKSVAGITASNKTIQKYLNEIAEEANEKPVSEKKERPKKEKEITLLSIQKSLENLEGLCEGYRKAHDDEPLCETLLKWEETLADFESELAQNE